METTVRQSQVAGTKVLLSFHKALPTLGHDFRVKGLFLHGRLRSFECHFTSIPTVYSLRIDGLENRPRSAHSSPWGYRMIGGASVFLHLPKLSPSHC